MITLPSGTSSVIYPNYPKHKKPQLKEYSPHKNKLPIIKPTIFIAYQTAYKRTLIPFKTPQRTTPKEQNSEKCVRPSKINTNFARRSAEEDSVSFTVVFPLLLFHLSPSNPSINACFLTTKLIVSVLTKSLKSFRFLLLILTFFRSMICLIQIIIF